MISPSFREVDIPIENGFVGMVDREHFDEFLRIRAAKKGAYRLTGTFQKIDRSGNFPKIHYKDKLSGKKETIIARLVIGADGRAGLCCLDYELEAQVGDVTKNTIEEIEVYENMGFKKTDSEIRNPDGSIVFRANNNAFDISSGSNT